MSIITRDISKKLMCADHRIAKMYCQNQVIYSSGNIVTYMVDTNVSYQEEVDEGASCLSPKTFTPSKSGWSFVGWRQDKTASASVLGSLVMGDDPVTLYAVFQRTVTLSYNGNGNTGGSTAAQTGARYYNNDNVVNPSFTLKANGFSRTNYNFQKWAIGSASGTQYAAGTNITLSTSTTFYAVWTIQTVVITFVEDGVSTKVTYNKGTAVIRSTAPSGATFVGWSTSSSGVDPVTTFTATSDATYYRVVKYDDYIAANLQWASYGNLSNGTGPFTIDTNKYPTVSLGAWGSHGRAELCIGMVESRDEDDNGNGYYDAIGTYAIAEGDNETGPGWTYNITPKPNSYLVVHMDQEYWAFAQVIAIGKTTVG